VEEQKKKEQDQEDMIKRGPNINKRLDNVKVDKHLNDKTNNIKGI